MAAAQLVALALGAAGAVFPWRRLPGWVCPLAVAAVALISRVVPLSTARSAGDDLAAAIAFLLLAVPLAVLLDEAGFFAAIAARVGSGSHLRSGLWILAALVTIVFNLDAAVVLLTPLYVRIAQRRGEDPVQFGAMPALLACCASSVLPVSNLTNLIAIEHLDVGTGSFIAHLGLPSLAAIAVGGWIYLRAMPPRSVAASGDGSWRDGPPSDDSTSDEPVHDGASGAIARGSAEEARALRIGLPIVVWLLIGFTLGERAGVPAWVVAGLALMALMILQRAVPWRHAPSGAAALAVSLGVLAAAAADHLPVERLLAIRGIGGELATVAATALGSNAINNLPAVLLTLPGLDHHPARLWAVLLGANIGPALWVTGALSTLLWQATMRRLGHPVSSMGYVRLAARAGVAALAAATAVHVVLVLAF